MAEQGRFVVHTRRRAGLTVQGPAENHGGWGSSGRALEAGLPETTQRAWEGASWGDGGQMGEAGVWLALAWAEELMETLPAAYIQASSEGKKIASEGPWVD